jgi:uncharacterized protein
MTPQEHELISGLFDRLSRLETQPRDAEAERAIAEGLSRAPHAIYALVQTVLVQDEALKAANARIEQLQAALGSGGQAARPPGGFLDNVRDALFGHPEERRPSSVPPVGAPQRPAYPPPPPPPNAPQGGAMPQGGYAPTGQGPSFLGTAAAAAAGTIGGSLLLGGVGHGPFAGTFGGLAGTPVEVVNEYVRPQDSPWADSGDLADQAGASDIDRDDGPFADSGDADTGADYADYDDGSFDDDSSGGSDYA